MLCFRIRALSKEDLRSVSLSMTRPRNAGKKRDFTELRFRKATVVSVSAEPSSCPDAISCSDSKAERAPSDGGVRRAVRREDEKKPCVIGFASSQNFRLSSSQTLHIQRVNVPERIVNVDRICIFATFLWCSPSVARQRSITVYGGWCT